MMDGPALPQRSGTVATRTTTASMSEDESTAVPDSDYSAVSFVCSSVLDRWSECKGGCMHTSTNRGQG